jgi:hypothetical protein
MKNLLIVFGLSVILAYASQYYGHNYQLEAGEKKKINICIVAMVVLMVIFVGLRVGYNDTATYIKGFQNSETLSLFLADKENLNLLHNPLFYAIQAFFRTHTENYHLFFMFWAMIDVPLLVRFILRYTDGEDFAFAIFLFFALGTFVFGMAALKQITGMAILTLAVPYLLDKKYLPYTIIVCIAALVHTYAILFLVMIFFRSKPWDAKTLLLIIATVGVIRTFDGTILSLLEYADSIGKSVSADEVFDGNRMSIFRVAVFAVTPMAIFIFRKRLLPYMNRAQELFTNMGIISLMFMLLASQNGANMFGRIATYFELGITCMLPWTLKNLFERRSCKIISMLCMVCFVLFFLYDNSGFDASYRTINLIEFIKMAV